MWIAIAWGAAALVGVVVLGFCGYDVSYKSRAVRAELESLQVLLGQLTEVQAQLTVAGERVPKRG